MLHEIRRRLVERLRLHWDIQRLEALDDRLLADMGITRETIANQVRGGTQLEQGSNSCTQQYSARSARSAA